MPNIPFCKLIPSGNATIIIPAAVDAQKLPAMAARLMHPFHIQAEQVGALSIEGPSPSLHMMGGEFCVNATRAATLLLARQGMLRSAAQHTLCGEMTVSGMPMPVRVAAAPTQDALRDCIAALEASGALEGERETFSGTALYCAARVDLAKIAMAHIAPGAVLVNMPGMLHLLLDADQHPLPDDWRAHAAHWRARAGIADAEASGVIWHARENGKRRIWPAVAVAATASEHMETACGSASLALALMLHSQGEDQVLPVVQPSGDALEVALFSASGGRHAWVSGEVRLVAEGTAFFS